MPSQLLEAGMNLPQGKTASISTSQTHIDSALASHLAWLQWAAPLAVLGGVLAYEIIFELITPTNAPPMSRFTVEVLVFGVLGSVILWFSLRWLRRHLEQEISLISELNRALETQVAQRTRDLVAANAELSQHERELEKANIELQQLDQLKTEFVSLVSHELRAPLSNISGSLQLVLMDAEEGDLLSSTSREILTLANEQAERLARLVKSILDVSLLQAGQLALNTREFDLFELIQETLAQAAPTDRSHHYHAPPATNLPPVNADRDRVEQVLINLLDNAAKYSPRDTDISLDAQAVNGEMVVSVTDQGIGIAPEELERIFDQFHRIELGDARSTYGYGLGLYISRKLVEAMGGRLEVESELGIGSRFHFSLPISPTVSAEELLELTGEGGDYAESHLIRPQASAPYAQYGPGSNQ